MVRSPAPSQIKRSSDGSFLLSYFRPERFGPSRYREVENIAKAIRLRKSPKFSVYSYVCVFVSADRKAGDVGTEE